MKSDVFVTPDSVKHVEAVLRLLQEGMLLDANVYMEANLGGDSVGIVESEKAFFRFDKSLQQVLEENKNRFDFSCILQHIMKSPMDFATNRFDKRLFRRLVDWAASGGNVSLSVTAHPMALGLGCYE